MSIENMLTMDGAAFNVRLFGAKGDGVTDDTVAIQSAIDAAVSQPFGAACIVFPSGRYLINRYNPGSLGIGARLLLDSAHGTKVHLLGLGDAVLVSNDTPIPSHDPDALLAIWGPNYIDVVIENLTFNRKPTPATGQVNAISINSVEGQCIRPTIRGCVFVDFPQAIELSLTNGALIAGCHWAYTDGIACGRGNVPGVPNVGIRCDNCVATQVVDNYWCGTKKTTEPAASFPMDGFVWGISSGWTIRGNVIQRAFYEAIYCMASQASGDASSSSIIEGNTIDCDFPSSLDMATMRGAVRQGIRVDDCYALITGNHIRKA